VTTNVGRSSQRSGILGRVRFELVVTALWDAKTDIAGYWRRVYRPVSPDDGTIFEPIRVESQD
jgi:hypothetical protein